MIKRIFCITVLIALCLSSLSVCFAAKEFKSEYKDGLSPTALYVYEALLSNAEKMKSGKEKISVPFPKNTLAEGIEDEVQCAIAAFILDNPQIFWISFENFYFSFKSTENEHGDTVILEGAFERKDKSKLYLTECYESKKEIEEDIEAVNDKVSQILKEAKAYTTQYGKLKFFYDYLSKNNKYNSYVEDGKEDRASAKAWSAVSAFLSENDASEGPVCEGFVKAFKILCDRVGIPCVLISGDSVTVKNSEESIGAHMWCYVMLDGKWYAADPTWDNTEDKNGNHVDAYDYFLIGGKTDTPHGKGSAEFSQTHLPNIKKYLKAQLVIPKLNDDKYVFDNTSKSEISISAQPISCVYGDDVVFNASVDTYGNDVKGTVSVYKDRVSEFDLVGTFEFQNGENSVKIEGGKLTYDTRRLVFCFDGNENISPCIFSADVSVSAKSINVSADKVTPEIYSDKTCGVKGSLEVLGEFDDEIQLSYSADAAISNDGKSVTVSFKNIESLNKNYKVANTSFEVEYEMSADDVQDSKMLFYIAGACAAAAVVLVLYFIISRRRK